MSEPSPVTANQLIGKYVLVGITRLDHSGNVISQEQKHGHVTAVDSVIHLRLASGQDYTLPPDPESFMPAAPGEYHLRTTGEVVSDPDFTASWTVASPAP